MKALKVLLSVILTINLVVTTLFLILDTTIYNENYMKGKLEKSDIVGVNIDKKVDRIITGDMEKYLNVDEIKNSLREPVKDDVEDVILVALYHVHEADAKFLEIQNNIENTILNTVTGGNSIIESLLKSSIETASNKLTQSMKDEIHYDKLKTLGLIKYNTIPFIKIILYISAVVLVISFLILLVMKSFNQLALSFLISTIVILIGAIGVKFIPITMYENIDNFIKIVKSSVAAYLFMGSALNFLGSVLFFALNKLRRN